ncbi:hypothetical protein [Haploplasma axanthum]|nr:hypothetical protein [Haploplasma axanthum]
MLVPFKSWYLKAEYADFEYYDTYAYSDAYNHVPLDMPNMKYNQGGLRNAN